MDVNFACPICSKRLALDQKWLGREVQCPFCNSVFSFTAEMTERTVLGQASSADRALSPNHCQLQRNAVTFEADPVGFWARVAAELIDAIVTLVASVVIAVVVGIFVGVIGGDAEFIGQLVGVGTSWLYGALMESSNVQATLGKLLIGAKVVDTSGEKISFGRATGRHFAKYISAFLLFVGYIMVAFDERKRGLHDMIAGTYVIARR